MDIPQTERSTTRVDEVIAEYLQALESGNPVDRSEWLNRYPELRSQLERFFESEVELERLAGPLRTVFDSTDPPTPHQLGDFVIRREIGRGGMGVVYEAEQISLGRKVALKVLPFAAVLDKRQLQRFKNEAQAAAVLKHPNIVGVYSVGCERGVHFYAMELVEGHSLAEVLENLRERADDRSDEAERRTSQADADAETQPIAALSTEGDTHSPGYFRSVARLGTQAAEALEYAHQLGIVHRDIKPSNLMVEPGGHLWITDFGLAQVQSDNNLTMTGDLLGTLRYMSPEQAGGRRAILDH